jgi:putative solute:sodium symporter small subunit
MTSPSTSGRKPAHRISPQRRAYWRANLRLIAILLGTWAIVSYGAGILLIEHLNKVRLGQVPLGFWFAQQGSIYIFVILIFIYAWRMDRLDRKYGMSEETPHRPRETKKGRK